VLKDFKSIEQFLIPWKGKERYGKRKKKKRQKVEGEEEESRGPSKGRWYCVTGCFRRNVGHVSKHPLTMSFERQSV
jgi:hypothetical protein